MEGTGHTILTGDVLTATIAGTPTLVTVERVTANLVYTSDWRVWWYGHPAHGNGEALDGAPNTLYVYGQLMLAPAPEEIAA